jgi:ring-1,2-phenylacetyl-CoA epoxidase subunit PaaC
MVRLFFFDHAEAIRFEMLTETVFEPLAMVAKKFKGEIKYHTMHADIFMQKLAAGGEESFGRMQQAINDTFGLALGMFEPGAYEAELIEAGIFGGEAELQQRWLDKVVPLLTSYGYMVPSVDAVEPAFGGRKGVHTPHLQPLLDEMTEVFSIDPGADW